MIRFFQSYFDNSQVEFTEKEDQRRKLTPTVMIASFSKEFEVK